MNSDERERNPSRGAIEALLRLASIDKDDWESAIQHILEVDAELLGVGRVSYWALCHDPAALKCEMVYLDSSRAFERGFVVYESDHPQYFAALRARRCIEVTDVRTDPRTASLAEYLDARAISSLLDVPVIVNGTLAGVLSHEQVGPRRIWEVDDAKLAVSVSHAVASALEARRRSHAESEAWRAAFLDQASSTRCSTR